MFSCWMFGSWVSISQAILIMPFLPIGTMKINLRKEQKLLIKTNPFTLIALAVQEVEPPQIG